jgi:site-specific recombinase XerD
LNKVLIESYIKCLRESKLSAASINQKLSANRKLATEVEDNVLIDSRPANGIRAVKGVPFRGRRTGNWLTCEEAQKWLNAPDAKTLKGIRDRTLLAVLIGCGLRRAEASILSLSMEPDWIQTTEKYLGVEQDLTDAPCDYLGLRISN